MKNLEEDSKIDTIELDEERAKKAKANIETMGFSNNINVIQGDAVDILQTLECQYDVIFIDAAKGKYPIFLNEAIRLSKNGTYIFADNVLYKGYVLSDYNKHKQRTAVRHLREFLKEIEENENLDSQLLEVGDGLSISKVIK